MLQSSTAITRARSPAAWPCASLLSEFTSRWVGLLSWLPFFGLTHPLLLAQTQCRLRMVNCRFCSASVRAGDPPSSYADREKGLTEHESYCGARTAACALCGQAVLLKENDVHFLLAHPGAPVLDPSSELPPVSRATRADDAMVGNGRSGLGPGDAADGADARWACPSCTFSNARERSTCEMCSGRRPAAAASSAVSAAASLPPRAPISRPMQCRNAPCAGLSSTSGAAAEAGLCSRCFSQFAAEAPDQDELVSSLSRRYAHQLSMGCGQRGCANPYCATARAAKESVTSPSDALPPHPTLTRQPSTSGDLAHLLGLASQAGHLAQYFVCVPVIPSAASAPVVASASAAITSSINATSSTTSSRRAAAASRIARADF